MTIAIRRYCGRERLPGGERLWRRLARSVGFKGNIYVFGYGVGGQPGREQRLGYHDASLTCTLGDYSPGKIRVWLQCSGCSAVDFDEDLDLAQPSDLPITVLAHELGHHVQYMRSKGYATDAAEEAVASRYGRWLLRNLD